MRKTYHLILILVILIGCGTSHYYAQSSAQAVQEYVSLSENTHINDAVQILETFSWKYNKKKMINMSSYNASIGVPINNLLWQKALELILLKNNLRLEEKAGYIAIVDPEIAQKPKSQEAMVREATAAVTSLPTEVTGILESVEEKADEVDVHGAQIRIKSIVMLADKAFLKSLGIDWSTILDGKVQATAGFMGASTISPDGINIGVKRSTSFLGEPIEVNTLIRTLESNQKGTVIAQPIIMVSSGKKGFIQVGQDISVKSVDDAGNTVDVFFATGVIMDVTPTVVYKEGIPLIHLTASIERSSATPGSISTVINKSQSSTELVLYDGEETVIGGLYDTDEVRIRSGIPILKDLPWWVFGLRYLTGYDKYERKEREMIIILKVEVVESALERLRKKNQASD